MQGSCPTAESICLKAAANSQLVADTRSGHRLEALRPVPGVQTGSESACAKGQSSLFRIRKEFIENQVNASVK